MGTGAAATTIQDADETAVYIVQICQGDSVGKRQLSTYTLPSRPHGRQHMKFRPTEGGAMDTPLFAKKLLLE